MTQIPEVALLDDHVRRFLHLADVEYERVSNQLPYEVQQQYRTALVRARGLPALTAVARWAEAEVPEAVCARIHDNVVAGADALQCMETSRAQQSLHAACFDLVRHLPHRQAYDEAVRCAALSATLVQVAELVHVAMGCDFGKEPANVWPLVAAKQNEEVLVSVLVSASHGISEFDVSSVRSALTNAEVDEHAALIMALWALESGAISHLRDAIHGQLDQRRREWHEFVRSQPFFWDVEGPELPTRLALINGASADS